jgi:hypothetical protein
MRQNQTLVPNFKLYIKQLAFSVITVLIINLYPHHEKKFTLAVLLGYFNSPR